MKILFLSLMSANFISYFWSVIGIFKKVKEQDMRQYRMLQLNNILIWLFSIHFTLQSSQADHIYLLGSGFQLFCFVAFWFHSRIVRENQFSIAFSKDLPERLVTKGFYARVRHPFYMIYLICYYSVSVILQNAFLLILTMFMTYIYYRAARFEESKFKQSSLSDSYVEYTRRTGLFWPKFGSKAE